MPDLEPGPTRATPQPVTEIEAGPGRASRILDLVRIDVSPLRSSRDFRLLFIGQSVSFAGTMVTFVALPFQAYLLTRSSLVVGLLSLAELLPILVLSFVGGALADSVDRRRMVRLTEVAMCLVTGALLVNALVARPQTWLLFVAAAMAGGIDAVQRPSLEALTPHLVTREQIPAAAALSGIRGSLGQVLGPVLAGVLIASAGLPATYGVDVASFGVSLIALSRMRAAPPPADAPRLGWSAVAAGLGYAVSRGELLGSYLVDMNAMFFGMPLALFPQVADSLGGATVLGLLYAAPSAGSLVASVTSGWTHRVRRHGRAIAVAAAAWGVAIIGFGLANQLWLALLALGLAGAADMVSGLFRMTLWNQTIPTPMRGRLAGIEMITYTSGPALGNLEAGIAETLIGLRGSIVAGGVLCVAGTAVLAGLLPGFWGYTAEARFPKPIS